jgi:hypothetical protein
MAQQLAVAIIIIILRCVYGTTIQTSPVEKLEMTKVQTKKRPIASSHASGAMLDELHSVLCKDLVSFVRLRAKMATSPTINKTLGPNTYFSWDESIYLLLKHRLLSPIPRLSSSLNRNIIYLNAGCTTDTVMCRLHFVKPLQPVVM